MSRTPLRSRLIGLGMALVATAGLTACAGGSMSAGSAGQEGDPSTITFWSNHPGSSRDTELALIEEFEKQNPDLDVELVTAGSNYEEVAQRFNAALAGGDLPDVVVASDVTWFNFALNEATTPLEDLWQENNIDAESYVDTLRDDYEYNGKHYGVPYARSTNLMYWNTDDLQAAGLPTDRGPETWQEFDKWAQKIKADLNKPALTIPDGSNYLDWYFQGMVWAFDGAYSDEWTPTFTSPGTIEAGKFLQDQVRKGHVEISTDPTVAFGNGNVSGLLQSTGSLGGLNKSATVPFITTFLPGPSPSAATGGAGLAIPNGISDERKANAVKFADFMTNEENTITFSQATGYMPVRKDAVTNPREEQFLNENPNARTAIEQLGENTQPQDYARVFVPGGGQRIGAALDRITIGNEDVETVFDELNKETEQVVKRDIEPKL
ncbi:ABC transporter substrate-binding protein [Corynebacterium sanguinis]|uniref:ABC transporter substrate-binding protein n=2 Tax=Corynebacterium sanguinis TaxID=2594913 RepID=UPI001B85BB87|nr:ABC transporter substrate-binding protein [Corynebacterium sanguinis]MCT1412456.1 ABC transporter substrate-binding protein [Corynebacterium sanguinis]MCT1443581.1 ABC transporter substrate-binding protein [Corynebacterium sanguinis]MCT1493274.1 ABC transporter substrate-binding protein [Corynebacterium sanguinis]MCT1498713.1 ABC transporter substrate-binding protein [Corynebacterium sanguinis]MCT1664764.1 ABC transporter substrate-binding protein [Corynebacterium sanguinis]